MGVDLKFTTAGAPDHTYYSLLKFGDNNKLDATLRALSDGQGNDIGIKISTTQVSIDSALVMSSLTASKLVYLNASNILTTIADGTVGQALVTDGAGVYTFATVAGGGGITINSTAITSGTAGRILFENASNQVSEAAGLTYSSGLFTVLGTTQQAKFAYDASNHLGITIGSTGNATYALTGASPVNIFNQYIGVGKIPTDPIDVLTNVSGVGNGTNISFKNSNTGGWASFKAINNLDYYCYYGVAGSAWATYGAIVASDSVIYTGRPLTLAVDSNNSIKFATGAGSTQRMVITGTGLVGIGTTPIEKLTISGNTSVLNGHVLINPTTSTGSEFALKGRSLTFPVPYLTPTLNNTCIAFDLFPKGSPSNAFGSADLGVAWFDICSTDIEADGTNFECLRLGKLSSSYANLTTAKGGTGTVRDLVLQINGGNIGVNTATVSAKFHIISTTEQLRSGYDSSNYASFTTGATGSLTIALTGTSPRTTFSQGVTMGGTLRLTPYTVATLPSGVVGDTAYVTDATAPTYLGALTGGGAVTCPVFYNGSAWVSA